MADSKGPPLPALLPCGLQAASLKPSLFSHRLPHLPVPACSSSAFPSDCLVLCCPPPAFPVSCSSLGAS